MANTELTLDFSEGVQLAFNMQTQLSPANVNRNIRLFRADDLSVMADWWKYHRKDDFFPEMLSNLGVVVEGEVQEAIGFLYETNSARCFSDFCIVNPTLPKKKREKAISALMDSLIGIATGRGFKVMEITVRNNSLLRRCKNKGFVELGEIKYLGRQLCLAS